LPNLGPVSAPSAFSVHELLARNKTNVIAHPPCSQDLAICDFFFYYKTQGGVNLISEKRKLKDGSYTEAVV